MRDFHPVACTFQLGVWPAEDPRDGDTLYCWMRRRKLLAGIVLQIISITVDAQPEHDFRARGWFMLMKTIRYVHKTPRRHEPLKVE